MQVDQQILPVILGDGLDDFLPRLGRRQFGDPFQLRRFQPLGLAEFGFCFTDFLQPTFEIFQFLIEIKLPLIQRFFFF